MARFLPPVFGVLAATRLRRRLGVSVALLALLFNSLAISMHVHPSWYGEPERTGSTYLASVFDSPSSEQGDGARSGHAPATDHCLLCQQLAQGIVYLPATPVLVASLPVVAVAPHAEARAFSVSFGSAFHWSSRAPPAV